MELILAEITISFFGVGHAARSWLMTEVLSSDGDTAKLYKEEVELAEKDIVVGLCRKCRGIICLFVFAKVDAPFLRPYNTWSVRIQSIIPGYWRQINLNPRGKMLIQNEAMSSSGHKHSYPEGRDFVAVTTQRLLIIFFPPNVKHVFKYKRYLLAF